MTSLTLKQQYHPEINLLVELATLPSVSLFQKAELPEVSGIYFVIDSLERVRYIGKAVNIRKRWRNHHRLRELKVLDNVRIAWIRIENIIFLEDFEQRLIKHFDPPLNWSNQAAYKEPIKQAAILSSAQIELLFSEGLQSDRERALFGVCFYTAASIGETCSILSEDVYSSTGRVREIIKIKKKREGVNLQAGQFQSIQNYERC